MAEDYKSAGWYPAPDGSPGERWWNGAGWSDSRRGGVGAPVPTVAPAAQRPDPYSPNPYAPAAPPPVRAGVRVDARNNPLATGALVLGAISAFGFGIVGPIAIVLSIIAAVRSRRLKARGGAGSSIVLALIGLGLGVVGTIQLIVFAAVFVGEIGNV